MCSQAFGNVTDYKDFLLCTFIINKLKSDNNNFVPEEEDVEMSGSVAMSSSNRSMINPYSDQNRTLDGETPY